MNSPKTAWDPDSDPLEAIEALEKALEKQERRKEKRSPVTLMKSENGLSILSLNEQFSSGVGLFSLTESSGLTIERKTT